MAATPSFREALSEGIASGTLVDTKIILFSRKNRSGRVYGPKPLYASSHVLKSVPYFDHLLFGNFMEAELKDFDEVLDDEESSSDYDYDSDSDLEDQTAVDTLKSVLKRVVCPVKETPREIASHGSSLERVLRAYSLFRPIRGMPYGPSYEKYLERPCKGKVVKIPDTAFVTFQAFLLYLYTGEIKFAPVKSSGKNFNWRFIPREYPFHDDTPRPSPWSIYRLADKYDIPALKNLALRRIRLELQNRDIVEETFSKFASRYDEIRSECITQLLYVIAGGTDQTVSNRVSAIVDRHSRGDLEYVGDTLSLLRSAAKPIASPCTGFIRRIRIHREGLPPPIQKPTNWKALRAAMVKSVKQGVFFDQKYWTRHSKDGRVLKPIYFSSLITGNAFQKCIVRSDGQDVTMEPPSEESDAESDCESDHTGAGEPASTLSQGDGEVGQVRAILTPGSFATWRSLFFYLCTDNIQFAPLRSQGTDLRFRCIRNAESGTPPPCSPKSIYALARSLNLQHLSKFSSWDIGRKLSEDNIVEELTSHVSFTYKEVREMECRLFFSRFQNEATVRQMEERFAGIGTSRPMYQADVFKLWLQSALDVEKRSRLVAGGGVML